MTVYRFSTDADACNFAREHIARGMDAAVTPMPAPGADAVVKTGADIYADQLDQFAAAVKQLCKDFSDLRDRPYMGDVTAAIDALRAQFN